MRIGGIGTPVGGEGRALEAEVRFEDADVAPLRLAFAVDGRGASDLVASAEPLVLACFGAALARGERRIRVEGPLCPVLVDRIRDAVRFLRGHWPAIPALALEAEGGFEARRPRPAPRAGLLLSGGIDSLALLRHERLHVPSDHPASCRDAIFVVGTNTHDHGEAGIQPARRAAYARQQERLGRVARLAGLDLVTVRTNARGLYPDWESYLMVGWLPVLAAAGLALGSRITHLWHGSGGRGAAEARRPGVSGLLPVGGIGDGAVDVRVGQPWTTRFEKTGLVAAWAEVREHVQVCLDHEDPVSGRVNCGRCEKCLRTMVELLAHGRLEDMPTFPVHDVTPEMLAPLRLSEIDARTYWAEPLPALAARGRDDLVRAIRGLARRAAGKARRARRRARFRRRPGASPFAGAGWADGPST